MTKRLFDSIQLRRLLTRRFFIALLLVSLTIGASSITAFQHLSQNRLDGQLVNQSGRQRMLSQRIALLVGTGGGVDQAKECVREMLSNHETLTQATASSPEVQRLYFGLDGCDALQRKFLTSAHASLAIDSADQSLAIDQVMAMSASGLLLSKLNAVVQQLEADYAAKQASFLHSQMVLALLSLVILVGLMHFVFTPTVALVGQSLEELEVSNKELTEFSYRISHDLRAPIVAALAIAEVGSESLQERDYETVGYSLSHVQKSLQRVLVTVKDIISLVHQKMSDVEPEEIMLSGLIEGCVDAIKQHSDFDAVELEIHCDESLTVFTKRVYLQQSIENLVSNAIKYRDTSASPPRVQIHVQGDADNCQLSVMDNGLGIDEPYRERLFKMFERFHPKVSYGTGLGLYLVRENIVSGLNGTIQYRALEQGSQFDISFPSLRA